MSHPSLYYIKYLLVSGRESGSDSYGCINATLKDLELPEIETEVFDRIKLLFKIPNKLMLYNKTHDPTIEFMKEERIHAIWNPTGDDAGIFEFLALVRPRETAQILLMGGISFEDIAQKVTFKHGLHKQLPARVIEMLHHYFWNTTYTSHNEWTRYIRSWTDSDKYLGAIYGETHALFKAGIKQDPPGKDALRDAYLNIHIRLESTRFLPTCKDTADIVSKLTKELVALYEAIYGEGDDLKNIVKELQAFKLQSGASKIKSITDIVTAGGSFSGNGGKINAKVNVVAGDREMGEGLGVEDGGDSKKDSSES